MVDLREPGIQPLTNLLKIAVFPTPESPTMTIFLRANDAVGLDDLSVVGSFWKPNFIGPLAFEDDSDSSNFYLSTILIDLIILNSYSNI